MRQSAKIKVAGRKLAGASPGQMQGTRKEGYPGCIHEAKSRLQTGAPSIPSTQRHLPRFKNVAADMSRLKLPSRAQPFAENRWGQVWTCDIGLMGLRHQLPELRLVPRPGFQCSARHHRSFIKHRARLQRQAPRNFRRHHSPALHKNPPAPPPASAFPSLHAPGSSPRARSRLLSLATGCIFLCFSPSSNEGTRTSARLD
jgi:hypothetical protein